MMARAVRASRADLEALLRARKLDTTLTSAFAFPELLDERVVVPTGVAVLDEQLHGGVPRGQMSEIVGPRSSGRTSLLFAMLAGATARGEMAALIDTLDTFDVASAAACGIDLGRLLWIRGQGPGASGRWSVVSGQRDTRDLPATGHRPLAPASCLEAVVDRTIKALNLVLQAGGFGLVALDLAEVPLAAVRRLPFTTWLRLQRVIEGSETACVLVGPAPVARSAGGVTIALQCRDQWSGASGEGPGAGGQGPGADERRSSRFAVLSSQGVTRDLPRTENRELRTNKPQARLFLGLEVEAHLSRARWPETAPCRFQFGASYHL